MAQRPPLTDVPGTPAATCADTTAQTHLVCTPEPAVGGTMAADGTITVHLAAAAAQVDVPDVSGQAKDAATKALKDKGFDVKITYANDDKIDQDKVISQDVKDKAAPGATVTLTVSSGQQKVAVPNVVGKAVDEATQTLSDAGFSVVVNNKTVTESTQAGQVLDQSVKNTQAKQGTSITLTVGKLAEKVNMPPLQNVKVSQATKQLNDLKIGYSISGPQDPNAIVTATSVPAGTQLTPGVDQVTLVTQSATKTDDPKP
ncbi:PASTA domain-containing protein, partial [Kitasatospora phosalacinea]|uniref:PASTA domain-containing protein n=1 Tax=Kitasatospora phosalacinea TaxID=2065 RepID=UPI00364AA5FE